jgi:Zn-dependent M28 family amino/carboxypeptidase
MAASRPELAMSVGRKFALLIAFTLSATPALGYALWPWPWHPRTTADINGHDILARDRMISADVFEGRMPGTEQGEKAVRWIAAEMRYAGLRAGNDGSYFQDVPIANVTLDVSQSSLTFQTPQGPLAPKYGNDIVYWTPLFHDPDVSMSGSPLVFVGYGVVAPEYHWNDYAGVDVKGKTVVILINDPGNEDANPDPKFFKGKAISDYGRAAYKFEEAARQGAAAAIIVHETGPAAHGWPLAHDLSASTKIWIANEDGNEGMVPVQGWIRLDNAKILFKRAGFDYLQLKAAANRPGFKAIPMNGESLGAALHSRVLHFTTHNIIGVVRGRVHPDEYILYTAHWDHLGMKPDVHGPAGIYSGAIDNGIGVSSILEIGEAFANAEPAPERSIAIICWTMEEQGLLGSQYFAQHPLWPLDHIVGGVNLDANVPEGPAHDMTIAGSGESQLEDILADVLKAQKRVVTSDPEPEQDMFYRSDHISLARAGIPMLDPEGGYDLINGGKKAGQAVRDDYRLHHYHQPSDKFNPDWDMSGPVEDLQALYTLGDRLANSRQWPNWYADSQFRAARDREMKGSKIASAP